jgi:hypothetical protein
MDIAFGIAVDLDGAAYITGSTSSNDFPTLGGPDLSYNGWWDAFVVKVTTDGSGLVYAGYLGGSDDDIGHGIAVDVDGAAYITGFTWSSDFPTLGGLGLNPNGNEDAFVTKVKPDGSELIYSGFIGGSEVDRGLEIVVDDTGAAYIAGYTLSVDFPTLGGLDLSYHGGMDAFVAKVKPNGSRLVYAGYLGGDSGDEGYDIAVDQDGAAYITGHTESTDFPVLGGPDQSYHGARDIFVVKISPELTLRLFLPLVRK